MNFFEKLFPSHGLICIANIGPKGIKHRFFETLDDAVTNAMALDAQGYTVYMAQATYSKERLDAAYEYNKHVPAGSPKNAYKSRRSQNNVEAVKAFWLDIDCGEGKPYADQGKGCDAITEMVRATGLPFPCIMRSGNGLYAYWFLEEEISEDFDSV
jgi:hypothetical protein